MELALSKVQSLKGTLRPPSDKSITHRAFMFGAIARTPSKVWKPLMGEDCLSTLKCLGQMGLDYSIEGSYVDLNPPKDWRQPDADLDCGNSGTTMRLLAGLIASRPMMATLVGDESLSKRPMKRVAVPLNLMGAKVEGDTPPLKIEGAVLVGIRYDSPVASAQIKTATLLAGMRAAGETWVTEPAKSRDHTERMLSSLGVSVFEEGLSVGLKGGATFEGFEMTVPGDISSSAFFMVAAAIVPGAELVLSQLNLNPSRTGILDVFEQIGASFEVLNEESRMGELVGDVRVRFRDGLGPFVIEGDLVPRLIDEIPVLAVLATQLEGTSIIRNASELRVKESDRIELVANGLRGMGVEVETFADGMAIVGPCSLKGTAIDAHGDHRIAMAFAIASLICEGTMRISGAESILTSYPNFHEHLEQVIVR